MNEAQYERWKDFALRMARNAWRTSTPRRIERLTDELFGFFADVETHRDWQTMHSWDVSAPGAGLVCDWVSEFFNDIYAEQRDDGGRFYTMVRCCLRAGMDLASEPSSGVLGFTVGDLRHMYPEGLPDWITSKYDTPLQDAPDDAGIWL